MESSNKYVEFYGFRAQILLRAARIFPSETMILPVSSPGMSHPSITKEQEKKWEMGLSTAFVNMRNIPKSSFARKLVLLANKLPVKKVLAVPADNEEFELRVDNSTNATKLGRRFAHDFSWEKNTSVAYLAPELEGVRNYVVRLITLEGRTLDVVRKVADELGYRLLEGQAVTSFTKKFLYPGDAGEIVFGGSEWSSEKGRLIVVLSNFFGHKWNVEMRPVSNVSGWRMAMRWAVVSK